MKNKLYHPSKGVIELKGKTFSPLKGVQPQYMDKSGKPHTLDGSEIPFAKVEEQIKKERHDQMAKELEKKMQEMEKEAEQKKHQKEDSEKEAHHEEINRKHSEVVREIKEASSAIAEAVKAIPETVIPEFPDHIDEQKKWKEEIVTAIKDSKVEIPEADYSAIVEAVGKIKFPEVKIPEPKDYTKLLEEIKKALPENTDMSGVIEAIKNIPQFQIPSELISEGRIKVEVDRISLGGGSGGSGAATEQVLQDTLEQYHLSDFDAETDPIYIGKVDKDGKWFIKKITMATSQARYCKGDSDFQTSWSNRSSLTYDLINNIF